MSEYVVVVYEDMLIRQVAHLMFRDKLSGFPVLRRNKGLVGIVTIADLFMLIHKASKDHSDDDFEKEIARVRELQVKEVMSKNVHSVHPETTLNEIVHILVEKNIHGFPVIEEDRIIGILSRHDIVNAAFSFD